MEKLRSGSGATFDGLFLENPWYKSLFDDFRELSKNELPEDAASGCEFGSVCINTMLYLPWLVGQCRANGVVLKRGFLKHISEAITMSHTGAKADVIINTTGLMACRLGGVMDHKLAPARGQVVVVRNEAPYMAVKSGTDDAADEVVYMMTRAAGGGTILGGTYQKGQWESQPDPSIALRSKPGRHTTAPRRCSLTWGFAVMARAVEMVPELTNGQGIKGLDIVRHGVGLRPYREGGPRVERDKINDVHLIHSYGHGGFGYQVSFGCAQKVVELVHEALNRAKL